MMLAARVRFSLCELFSLFFPRARHVSLSISPDFKTQRKVCDTPGVLFKLYARSGDEPRREKAAMNLTRRLSAAKDAFNENDVAASRAAHEGKTVKRKATDSNADGGNNEIKYDAEEAHAGAGGKYVKSLVFGGLDGIITTFAVVAASKGGSLSTEIVLLMGFANLFADGLSMGFGDFLSSKAEHEYATTEKKREKWEFDNFPEGEKREMVEIYMQRGMKEEDATIIIETMSKYEDIFVDVMMVEELGLMPPEEESSFMNGLVTFIAFSLFGFVPLMPYLIGRLAKSGSEDALFASACVLTAFTLFSLGAAKARFTNQAQVKSGLFMLINGGLAAICAYLVSWGISEGLGVNSP